MLNVGINIASIAISGKWKGVTEFLFILMQIEKNSYMMKKMDYSGKYTYLFNHNCLYIFTPIE